MVTMPDEKNGAIFRDFMTRDSFGRFSKPVPSRKPKSFLAQSVLISWKTNGLKSFYSSAGARKARIKRVTCYPCCLDEPLSEFQAAEKGSYGKEDDPRRQTKHLELIALFVTLRVISWIAF